MPSAAIPLAPMPLFERLEDDAPFTQDEAPVQRTLTPQALRDSVRGELIRLLNTRRGSARAGLPLNVLDYGLPDWSANDAARTGDRSSLARDVLEAIAAFEPRLAQPRAEVEPDPEAPWRLRLRIAGILRTPDGGWPVAWVAQLIDGQPVGIVDERIA